MNRGRSASHGQRLTRTFADCMTRMLRETPCKKHLSMDWIILVRCQLSHSNKSLQFHVFQARDLLPKAMILASEHSRETGEP